MTSKEQAYFQSLVDNMYTQFVHDVATGRHSSDDKIKPLATGQVWTGQQSLPLGLIDKVGGYRVALLETAREAGISGEPSVVRPAKAKRGLLALLADERRRPVSQPEPAAEPSAWFLLYVEVTLGPSAFREHFACQTTSRPRKSLGETWRVEGFVHHFPGFCISLMEC